MPLAKGQTYKWADILRETGAANVLPYYLLRSRGGRTIVTAVQTTDTHLLDATLCQILNRAA